jgi:hypothetical protein
MMAGEQNDQYEALLFEYDLTNLAKEFWFRPDERWELSIVNAKQLTVLSKDYQPVLSISGAPKSIHAIRDIMDEKMQLYKNRSESDSVISEKDTTLFLVAFNPERLRK